MASRDIAAVISKNNVGSAAGAKPMGGMAEETTGEAAETAKQTTKDETNNAVRAGVRQGIRSLFGR